MKQHPIFRLIAVMLVVLVACVIAYTLYSIVWYRSHGVPNPPYLPKIGRIY